MGVPSEAGDGAMWSLDHLFLDADGVPVVVEVKRASDTRIRREVVGQMLDYAANGVKYRPIAGLRAAVDETAAGDGQTGEELVTALRAGIEPEEFWNSVEATWPLGWIRRCRAASQPKMPMDRRTHDFPILFAPVRNHCYHPP
jgi:hypothetical protein